MLVHQAMLAKMQAMEKKDVYALPPLYINTELYNYHEERNDAKWLPNSKKVSSLVCENIHHLKQQNKIVYTSYSSLVVINAKTMEFDYEIILP